MKPDEEREENDDGRVLSLGIVRGVGVWETRWGRERRRNENESENEGQRAYFVHCKLA